MVRSLQRAELKQAGNEIASLILSERFVVLCFSLVVLWLAAGCCIDLLWRKRAISNFNFAGMGLISLVTSHLLSVIISQKWGPHSVAEGPVMWPFDATSLVEAVILTVHSYVPSMFITICLGEFDDWCVDSFALFYL